MSFTTLVTVHAPTLADGLVELLRVGDTLQLAGSDMGVTVLRDQHGRLVDSELDPELPAGVLEDITMLPVDPWTTDPTSWDEYTSAEARRELLELLAHVNPDRDLLATADGAGYL